ncbi:AAA family ATPase [Ramlibacter sp. AW1]|uniref:AAA family ATPase n=1 Tax=Ramlibacter aurantiacus TaxID=2801330 RepID=A0A936ZLF9_9BURK|nr:AAA family ATPase [Ramlibacter aurantiacus]MBL0419410.1 AAA family ATPase [Ramlibacter aurantiacus]
MYAPFFGLRQEPFSIAPDPRYLYMSERHREALAHLLYGLSGGGGFVLLTGEIGTGKTTVCRCFLEQVPSHCNVGYIFNPKLTAVELLQSICDEFHIAVTPPQGREATIKDWLDPLNAFLLRSHADGRNNLLIIDEAQNLSPDVLEQLRLLTNLETASHKLLQIVLIGQPELRDMLERPELEQLSQRVIARYHLLPLTEDETAHYVNHRLQVAGLDRVPPFERRAIRRIHRHSRGIPRRINLLCDRAMLGAFAHTKGSITAATVDQAAREAFGTRSPASESPGRGARRLAWLAAACGLLAAGYVVGSGAWREPGLAAAGQLLAMWQDPPAKAAASPAAPEKPTPAAAPTAPPTAPTAPPQLLKDEEAAWRELAKAWRVDLPPRGSACAALGDKGLRCFTTSSTTLEQIRQLDRPGYVTLDADSGSPSYALLVGLTDDSATLEAGGSVQTVTLSALAARWDGEFATLWRTPRSYTGTQDDLRRDSPVLQWAASHLSDGEPTARAEMIRSPSRLRSGVRRFQTAQGLSVTGMLTAPTYMQLNRVAGVDEPRLRQQP